MNTRDFFSFGSKLAASTVQASFSESIELPGVANKSSLCENNLVRGNYESILFPAVFKQERGHKLQDVLDTGWPSLYLISDKMKHLLLEEGFTGWKSFNVKVLDKRKKEISGYHGFSITGRCGPIDYGKSTIIEKKIIPNGPLVKYYQGLHIGLDRWDGSDFFIPEATLWIIVSKKVCQLLQKSNFTNIRLENLLEIEIESDIVHPMPAVHGSKKLR